MDSVRSGEKSRHKTSKILQDLKANQFNFGNQEKKSASSRFGSRKTSPELETLPKHWAVVSEGFPPGVTVDELKKYGRRKQLVHLKPQDNLRLEEGSLKLYKSEYKRRFLPFSLPKILQSLEDDSEKSTNEDIDVLLKHQNSSWNSSFGRPVVQKPQNNILILKNLPMETLTEKSAKYIAYPHYERRKLMRRSTALKPEGDISCETEVRKEYVDYKNPEKAQIIRKLPFLKLEGEYEPLTTEQRDKFIAYLLSQRPVLEKKKTSLKMEGNFDFLTEKNSSYVPHELSERPRIRKRSTSLKLEGEVKFCPEYKHSFVDFPRTRPVTYKPIGKISHEGEFEAQTETKTQFVSFENVLIPQSAKRENNLHIEGEMEISPEYRNNFIDFPRERPFVRKPFNQLKSEGNLKLLTENDEKFYSFPDEQKSEKFLSPENVIENTIPEKIENLSSQPETELPTEKAKDFEKSEKQIANTRPLSLKQEREHFFGSDYRNFLIDEEKSKNQKLMKNVKSNSSSPRKKTSLGKIKLDFEDDKKPDEIFRSKSSTKRLKEGTLEKIPVLNQQATKFLEKPRGAHQLRFSEISPLESKRRDVSPREFLAFKVLDVKGQTGCQSMVNDVLDSEKSTSDEENPTYRLEVSDSGEGSQGFYKGNRRIFPDSALNSKRLEEAELRAKQRAENYVKIVKSPEIPNSLLEENKDVENRWRMSDRLCDFSPEENLNSRAFVVLDGKNEFPEGNGLKKKNPDYSRF